MAKNGTITALFLSMQNGGRKKRKVDKEESKKFKYHLFKNNAAYITGKNITLSFGFLGFSHSRLKDLTRALPN